MHYWSPPRWPCIHTPQTEKTRAGCEGVAHRECAGTGVDGMAHLWATGTKAAITHVGGLGSERKVQSRYKIKTFFVFSLGSSSWRTHKCHINRSWHTKFVSPDVCLIMNVFALDNKTSCVYVKVSRGIIFQEKKKPKTQIVQ